ncbi:MAG: hypothetical protein OSB26_05910 [Woeseiaceae bacterium]|jgi:hypothetical protein|nr:hypothetical protein [Woeseiaceae bacterium]|tara:strand:- start:85 stop:546 length:462 start_codon:yes stop_codon:yes gene_type:complete
MSAIRTTAFTIWLILFVISFEFGFSLPDKIDQLPASANNIPTMLFVFFVALLLLHFIGIARARWDSGESPIKLAVIENFIERKRMENFALAVQPTKLLIVCAGTIGFVGIIQTAISSQVTLSYIYSVFFLVVSAGQLYGYFRRKANSQSNDDV